MRRYPLTPTKPDVLITDFYCEKCGHRPGTWRINHVPMPLPVPEEAAYIRDLVKEAWHDKCGGKLVVATEPLR